MAIMEIPIPTYLLFAAKGSSLLSGRERQCVGVHEDAKKLSCDHHHPSYSQQWLDYVCDLENQGTPVSLLRWVPESEEKLVNSEVNHPSALLTQHP